MPAHIKVPVIGGLVLAVGGLVIALVSSSGTGRTMGELSAAVFGVFAALVFAGTRPSRELPEDIVQLLEASAPALGPHRVTLVLDDGSEVRNVRVAYGRYVELPFGRPRLRFDPKRVISARSETRGW